MIVLPAGGVEEMGHSGARTLRIGGGRQPRRGARNMPSMSRPLGSCAELGEQNAPRREQPFPMGQPIRQVC